MSGEDPDWYATKRQELRTVELQIAEKRAELANLEAAAASLWDELEAYVRSVSAG